MNPISSLRRILDGSCRVRPLRAARALAAPLAIAFALLTVATARPCFAVSFLLYDVDFGQPHLVGHPPVEGAEPIQRYLVSDIPFGEPLVVEAE
ncbi:MAG: hypothetical protein R3E97_24560, partial [Candidatus Eisenbacteria bacterium]